MKKIVSILSTIFLLSATLSSCTDLEENPYSSIPSDEFFNNEEEFLMSAEYIMAGGNMNVILCERGIRTFETYTRNTLDVSAVPAIKTLSHLPIIVDPSHATGISKLVKPMAFAATAAGADGLIIEVHNDPEHALCDGPQSLTPEAFDDVVKGVNSIRPFAYKM